MGRMWGMLDPVGPRRPDGIRKKRIVDKGEKTLLRNEHKFIVVCLFK